MNKQEATELRETIMRELPDGFTCSEIIDSSKWDVVKQEVTPIFWFTVKAEAIRYPYDVMGMHSPEHWELLKRFSFAIAMPVKERLIEEMLDRL